LVIFSLSSGNPEGVLRIVHTCDFLALLLRFLFKKRKKAKNMACFVANLPYIYVCKTIKLIPVQSACHLEDQLKREEPFKPPVVTVIKHFTF
jgi:hypothetical protein